MNDGEQAEQLTGAGIRLQLCWSESGVNKDMW